MGYDLYGLNPHNPKHLKKPESPDWKTATQKEQDLFFHKLNLYEEEVPGHYFRNNVWWWKPLWEFICISCDDILDDDDMGKGFHNGGEEIDKDKSEMIADRLFLLLKNKAVHKYQVKYETALKKLPLIECDICEGTGKRQEAPKIGKGEHECNGCSGTGKRKQWDTSYPFDSENVIQFAKFCSASGGFEIS